MELQGGIAAVLVKRVQICIGMAAPGYQEGDLFCLEPTSNDAPGWAGVDATSTNKLKSAITLKSSA